MVLSSLFPAALASQTPFIMSATRSESFAFKEGADIFSPKSLIELVRPGGGVANDAGDLLFVSISKHSLKDKEYVSTLFGYSVVITCHLRTNKSIYIAPLTANAASAQFLTLEEGDAFWLDARTLGHVVPGKDGKPQELYAVPLTYEGGSVSLASDAPVLIGTFPAPDLANFKYSAESAILVFSANVWPDVNRMCIPTWHRFP